MQSEPEAIPEQPAPSYEFGTFVIGNRELPLPVPAPEPTDDALVWTLELYNDVGITLLSSQGNHLELDPVEPPQGDLPVYSITRWRGNSRHPACTFTVTLPCEDWIQVDLHSGNAHVKLLHEAPFYMVYSNRMEVLRLYANGDLELEAKNPTLEKYKFLYQWASIYGYPQGFTRLELDARDAPNLYVEVTSDTKDWYYLGMGYDSPLPFTVPDRHSITP